MIDRRQFRQSATVVIHSSEEYVSEWMIRNFVRVALDAGSQVHEPVVKPKKVLKPVRVGIVEMHLADQAGVITALRKMIGNGVLQLSRSVLLMTPVVWG